MFSWTRLQDVYLDAEALGRLAHHCAPERCDAGSPCCGSYEIAFHKAEAPGIVGMLPSAGEFAPHLRDEGELVHPFDDTDDGFLAMDTDEQGLCMAAYRDRNSAVLCSLHSAALSAGLPPCQYKPRCCWLWPVSTLETRGRTYVSVCDDVYAFDCNTRRPGRQRSLHEGVAEILRGTFGEPTVSAVNARLAELPDPRPR
jgi:hypothetical protein